MDLESDKAMLVLADELEERGHPRAELVRAQTLGRECSELLGQHWSQWVGSLKPQSVLLRWKRGFLVDVAVRVSPDGWRLEELFGKPTTENLSRLALGPNVSSRGLEQARGLRHLVCFGTLQASELPTVVTLTLDVDGPSTRGLSSLIAPQLTALNTRVGAEHEASLFESLAHATWFAGLSTWTHRVASAETLGALLANGALVARGGAGAVFLCDEPVLKAISKELRTALPQAKFTLLPRPQRPHDPEDFNGPMVTNVAPANAPTNFRERPALEKTSDRGIQSDEPIRITIGSGYKLSPYLFSTCSWCGSSNTLGIWSRSSSLYSHFETTSYDSWEYECHDCGLFTSMRKATTR